MKRLLEMTTASSKGSAYLVYSRAPVTESEPLNEHEDVVVDYAADGSIVGIALRTVRSATIFALANAARRYDLDLAPLFTRPVEPQDAS